jgi:hypothetical protein
MVYGVWGVVKPVVIGVREKEREGSAIPTFYNSLLAVFEWPASLVP